jgi:hypothetical protein
MTPTARCDLRKQGLTRRAGEGNRTPVTSLEGWSSTIELHPHLIQSSGPAPTIGSAGRGAAWLARVLWEHEVGGSNPPAPTDKQGR